MNRIIATLLFCVALTGCATKLVPDDFAGPTATLRDSNVPDSIKKADFFYAGQVDGKTIQNTFSRTVERNSGLGLYMKTVSHERRVPIKKMTVRLEGRTHYAAPILALFGDETYNVSGEVTFQPKPGRTYVVKGVLGKGKSAVWIQDSRGRIVTKKVRAKK